jgi:hypothetical protein
VRWHARWRFPGRTPLPPLGPLIGDSPVTLRLSGRTARELTRLRHDWPGVLEALTVWPDADPGLLVPLLAISADVRAAEIRAPGFALVRWRGDTVFVRAPEASPVWDRWRRLVCDPASAPVQLRWQAHGRPRRAWRQDGVMGLEDLAADHYREWTVRWDPASGFEWTQFLEAWHQATVRALIPLGTSEGVPGPMPYYVERWRLAWQGQTLNPHTVFLPRTWRGEARWEVGGGQGEVAIGFARDQELAVHRFQWDPRGLDTGIIRRWRQALPVEDAWWEPPRRLGGRETWWQDLGQAHRVWHATQRPLPALVESTKSPWWHRWPAAGANTWMACHPWWPEQALVVFHSAQGPYGPHLSARWTLTGPRWDLPAPATSFREVLRWLAGMRAPLTEWWARLAVAQERFW